MITLGGLVQDIFNQGLQLGTFRQGSMELAYRLLLKGDEAGSASQLFSDSRVMIDIINYGLNEQVSVQASQAFSYWYIIKKEFTTVAMCSLNKQLYFHRSWHVSNLENTIFL